MESLIFGFHRRGAEIPFDPIGLPLQTLMIIIPELPSRFSFAMKRFHSAPASSPAWLP